jgi:hypothetical protein
MKESRTMDSDFSPVVTATSGVQPAPMPPTITSVTFNKPLVATVVVVTATNDVNSDPLTDLNNIEIVFGPTGSDLSAGTTPVGFPGIYAPGSSYAVDVTVPNYNTSYDFRAKDSD